MTILTTTYKNYTVETTPVLIDSSNNLYHGVVLLDNTGALIPTSTTGIIVNNGTNATGTTIPAGGTGSIGWLSGLYGQYIASISTLSPGTAPVNGIGILGTYNSSGVTLSNGQTASLQVDGYGNLLTNSQPSQVSWVSRSYTTFGSFSVWTALTVYTVGQQVQNGTNIYIATSSTGTSAASGGPTGTTTGITDGTVTWNYVGSAILFPTNTNRKAIRFQSPLNSAGIWVNFLGGNVGPNLTNCDYFSSYELYESKNVVGTGLVTVYCSISGLSISAKEG